MKLINIILCIPIMLVLVFFSGCYPTYHAAKTSADTLAAGDYSNLQAKVFKSDNSIVLFPDGFTIDSGQIKGIVPLPSDGSLRKLRKTVEFPIDSITAMTTYEETTSGGRYFGSFLLGLTGAPLLALGVYCIACPKCCFGSCPTIYTYDGKDYTLESELFSECISNQLESNDIDLLRQKVIADSYKLKITNEALETHYINKFEVVVAEHPVGTELYPSIKEDLLIVSKKSPPISAISKDGEDISCQLTEDDNQYYRSGVNKVSDLKKGPIFDWVDIKYPNAKNSPVKLVLKYRNTLLSTTLLYNIVIGSQGAEGLAWTKKMNEDAVYASQFKMIYDEFSGIKIKMFENGKWNYVGKFKDAGPLNWKYIAAQLPLTDSDTLLLRLEFIPDNFMIDYAGFDTSIISNDLIKTKIVYPTEITNGKGNQADSLLQYIKDNDKRYLITEPGDSYILNYSIPENINKEFTVLIYSKGYYNEWIRGSWINNKDNQYSFNLYDVNGTLSHLADSWIENCELLEREFFHSKFSLEENK